MTKKNREAVQVVKQDLALDIYLQNMLESISDQPIEATPEIPVKKATAEARPKPVAKEPETVVEKKITPPKPVINKAEKIAEVVAPQKTALPQVAQKVQPLSVMPDWSRQEFQALFFRIDKMTLAVPLTELLRTINYERKVTKIPGQPSWFLGLMDELDSRIGVLDTGQLIFGRIRGQRNLETQPFASILITADGKWGLACDEVLSIGKLEPEKIRWRTLRTKKPWLIGTDIDELTAVIDINKLVPHRKMK